MVKKNTSLLEGSVFSSLLLFTLPIMLSMVLQTTYGLVDMLIIGNFGTVSDVSAVSTGTQLMNFITAFCTGLTTGATVLIGQKIGAKENKQLAGIICQSIYLVMGTAAVITLILLICNHKVIAILNTPIDAWSETKSYIFYCSLGVPMVFTYSLLSGICRGFGNSIVPLFSIGVACVLNIFGDLILVKELGLGASGAAVATICSQFISVLLTLFILKKNNTLNIKFVKGDWVYDHGHMKILSHLGVPVAIRLALSSGAFLMMTSIVNNYGMVASAAVGLSDKLINLLMLAPLCFMQSIAVFAAQNSGANQINRAKEGLWVAVFTSLVIGVACAYITYFHGSFLANIFNHDQLVIEEASRYLQAYAIDMFFSPFMYCVAGFLSGCGYTFFVMIAGLVCAFLIRVPLFYFLIQQEPHSLFVAGLANPITTITQSVICFAFYAYLCKKWKETEKENF